MLDLFPHTYYLQLCRFCSILLWKKKKIVDNNQCVVVVKFLKVQSSHHYALPWLHHVYSNIIKPYTERKETDTLTDRQTAGGWLPSKFTTHEFIAGLCSLNRHGNMVHFLAPEWDILRPWPTGRLNMSPGVDLPLNITFGASMGSEHQALLEPQWVVNYQPLLEPQ